MADGSGGGVDAALSEDQPQAGEQQLELEAEVAQEQLPRPPALDPLLVNLVVESHEGEADEQGRFVGPGKTHYAGGHVYEGTYENGMMHGQGTYSWADGVKYTGSFHCNQRTGAGVLEWPDGSRYEGELLNGYRHGTGTYVVGGSGVTYEGQWRNGRRHGAGVMWYNAARTSFFKGTWVEDERCGKGILIYASGNVYEGDWEHDVKCGRGIMRWTDRGEVYEGEWAADKPHGVGVHAWLSGILMPGTTQQQMTNRYEGGFQHGLRSGYGVFFYANGSKYEGEWMNNQKHGHGVFTFEDGEIYEGPFENDRMADPRRPESKRQTGVPDGRMLRLRIEDILPSDHAGGTDRLLKAINNALLRANTHLRQVYQFYAGGVRGATELLFTMKLKQFWTLCQDCGFFSPSFTFAVVADMLAIIRQRHDDAIRQGFVAAEKPLPDRDVLVVEEGSGLFDPARPVLFREFLELLVRVADALNVGGSGVLLDQVEAVLVVLRERSMKAAVPSASRVLLESDGVQTVLRAQQPRLQAAFTRLAGASAKAVLGDVKVTIRSLVVALARAGLVGEGSVSTAGAAQIINSVHTGEECKDVSDATAATVVHIMNVDLVFLQFLEALVRLVNVVAPPTSEEGGDDFCTRLEGVIDRVCNA